MTKTKVIIVDDHRMFREGLRFLLTELPNIKIIAEAENGIEFLNLLNDNKPDIILMDINMPEMDGIEATKKALKIYPKLRIIAITMFGDENYYYKMVQAGAVGFLLKKSGSDELAEAIEKVMAGSDYFSVDLLKSIILTLGSRKQVKTQENNILQFSPREQEVFELICEGLSAKEIADRLHISPRTVDGYKSKLFDKTGTQNTSSLIMMGIKNKLIEI